MSSYDPLREPDAETPLPASVDGELRLAREYVASVASANIHDHKAMVKAAVGLDHRLRGLIAALDTERGETR
ncbi:hypothetical protein ACKI1J_14970 [Streptomyces scabiei]|uniref:hypothetical protein n=1 Tax=Streptomyces scabiei TaxID=1930 RepID=UPI0017CC0E0F|nr:hypothetical protein [Streptomyces sp.]